MAIGVFDSGIGGLTVHKALVGFIEVKAPGKGADPTRFKKDTHDALQWAKLKALPNLIYTDGNSFSLWQDGRLAGSVVHLDGDVETSGANLSAPPGLTALIENTVINWTLKGESRRIHVPFVVAFGADKERVRDAVLEAARDVPFTLPETSTRRTQVWLVGFGESALKFELIVWPTLEAVKRPKAMNAAYTWAIDDALRKACIEIPLPQREIRIRGLFGEEGQDALAALQLEQREHAAAQAPAPTINDAAEDLLKPEPPIEAPGDAPAPVEEKRAS